MIKPSRSLTITLQSKEIASVIVYAKDNRLQSRMVRITILEGWGGGILYDLELTKNGILGLLQTCYRDSVVVQIFCLASL